MLRVAAAGGEVLLCEMRLSHWFSANDKIQNLESGEGRLAVNGSVVALPSLESFFAHEFTLAVLDDLSVGLNGFWS